jgi:tetratricopeptide (TPR) repeat protein
MRALEKDRTRRYGSPQELAADIERHLSHEPVQASPPSAAYRAGKFVRRHRLGVAFAATAVVFLVAFAARERIQSRQIANERDRANSEAEAKGQVSDFLVGLFEVLDPSEARGNTITVREILDRGAERIDKGLNEQPLVQARLMDTIGQMYQSLGLYQQAGPLLENALRIRRSELGDEHLEVADSLAHLGSLRVYHGAPREVMSLQREALGIREKLLGIDHVDTGWSLYYVGSAHLLAGDLAEAEAYFDRALAILELEPDGRGMSWCLNDLGLLLKGRGDYAGAASFFERSLEIKERSMAPDHWDIGIALANLAFVWAHLGQDSEAESYFTRAMSILENALGADHPMVPYLAACYFAQIGRHTEALQHIRRAVDLGFVSSQVGSDPDLLPLHGYPEFDAIVAEVQQRIGEE